MEFRIADLKGINSAITSWMSTKYGDARSRNELLMVLAASRLAFNFNDDWSDHYRRLVQLIGTISYLSKRPLLIPSIKEFYNLVDDFWDQPEIRALRFSKKKPVYAHVDGEVMAAVVRYERAAKLARIEAAIAA